MTEREYVHNLIAFAVVAIILVIVLPLIGYQLGRDSVIEEQKQQACEDQGYVYDLGRDRCIEVIER